MIPILFAGNEKVFDGMVISSLSIVKHHHGALQVYLFTMDLTDVSPDYRPINEAQRQYLEEIYRNVNPQSRVLLVDVGNFYRKTLLNAKNQDNLYTPYSFLRLFADRVDFLPQKIIYLDTDTVLCGDISQLYGVDLGDAEFAAARDHYGRIFLGVNYLNSGVLLLNLPKIRETGLFQRALKKCAEKKIFLPDQTTINRLAVKKKILPRRFNEQHQCKKDTLIRHFSMTIRWFPKFRTQNVKPWQVENVHNILKIHQFDDILNDYLRRKPKFPMNKEGESLNELHHSRFLFR